MYIRWKYKPILCRDIECRRMTKPTLALIFAIIFIVAAFSKPLIPCGEFIEFNFCVLEGEDNYFYTPKLSDSWLAGGLAFVLAFLICLAIIYSIFPKKKIYAR